MNDCYTQCSAPRSESVELSPTFFDDLKQKPCSTLKMMLFSETQQQKNKTKINKINKK